MRTIKFRAKRNDNENWVCGSLVKTPFGFYIEWYEDSICNRVEIAPQHRLPVHRSTRLHRQGNLRGRHTKFPEYTIHSRRHSRTQAVLHPCRLRPRSILCIRRNRTAHITTTWQLRQDSHFRVESHM